MNDVIQFRISFSKAWILTKRGSAVLPPEEILHKLGDLFQVTDTASKIYECTGMIKDTSYDNETVVRMISDLIQDTYKISDADQIYTIELQEAEAEAEAQPAPAAKKPPHRSCTSPGRKRRKKRNFPLRNWSVRKNSRHWHRRVQNLPRI